MVGEIRDRETADTATRAALVGRLLFSSLHTNDSTAAVARMLDMGAEPYLLASTLAVVVAQRLVRRLCASCRGSYKPDAREIAALRLRADFAHLGPRPARVRRHQRVRGLDQRDPLLPLDRLPATAA